MDLPPGLKEKYNSLFEEKSSKGRRTSRGEVLRAFTERLNRERAGKFRPLTLKGVAKIFEGNTTDDLIQFFYECEKKGKWFSWWFWKSVKGEKTVSSKTKEKSG